MIHDDCILLINGKESLNDRFVSINIEKKYAMIPLVPVLEELGFPVKWTGKYTAVIDVYGEEYFLDTKNITLCKGIDGPNELMIPPGATHGVLTNWIDEVLTIDNDTLVWFISHLIGARISINYTTSTISIYFSK